MNYKFSPYRPVSWLHNINIYEINKTPLIYGSISVSGFTNGFCTIVYKRNIALSGLLVCRLIKSLSEVLSSKLSHSPSKLHFSVEFFIFRTLFQPRTLSVHIPAAWWDLFTKYVNIHMFVSDSFSSIKEGVVQGTDLVGYLALYPPSTYPAGDIFK